MFYGVRAGVKYHCIYNLGDYNTFFKSITLTDTRLFVPDKTPAEFTTR
jgi:hypothetical protein